MVVPRILGRTAYPLARHLLFPKRTSQAGTQNVGRLSACSSRWTRPCFSSTPRHITSAGFRPLGLAPETPKFGRQALDPLPDWRGGLVTSEALFGSDRRDPNTRAPNRVKARTTPLRPSRT